MSTHSITADVMDGTPERAAGDPRRARQTVVARPMGTRPMGTRPAATRPSWTAVLGIRLGAADLAAALLMSAFVLPPFRMSIGGRGGDVFPVELLLVLAVPLLLWRHNLRPVLRPVVTALAIYSVACLPSYVNATDMPRWIYGMMLLAVSVALLWCLTALRPRALHLDRLLTWSPLPFVALAVIIIVHQLATGAFFAAGSQKIQIGYGGSNFLASVMLIGAFVPLSVLLGGHGVLRKLAALVAFGVIALGIALTGSRLGTALLPVGIVLTVLFHLRSQGRRLIGPLIALLVILAIVAVLLVPYVQSLEARGKFHNLLQQRNLLTRLVLFDLYVEAFLHQPLIGIGMFNGRVNPVLAVLGEGSGAGWGANQNAHNWILQCLGDTGLIGLAGFLFFIVVAWRTYSRGAFCRRNPWQAISVGFFVGFIVVTLHGLLEPNFHGKPFIYFLVLTLGLADQVNRLVGRATAG